MLLTSCMPGTAPGGIIAMSFANVSVSHRLPSGPAVMIAGGVALGNEYSVNTPAVVTFATLCAGRKLSVNQRLPSDPAAILKGWLRPVGTGYSLKAPAVVTAPILLPDCSANHSLPSEPAVIPAGLLLAVGT